MGLKIDKGLFSDFFVLGRSFKMGLNLTPFLSWSQNSVSSQKSLKKEADQTVNNLVLTNNLNYTIASTLNYIRKLKTRSSNNNDNGFVGL